MAFSPDGQSPSGTASAEVLMAISSLNATIYVDEFAFRWERGRAG